MTFDPMRPLSSLSKPKDAYRLLVRGRAIEEIVRRELEKLDGDASISVPPDLDMQVRKYLKEHPEVRWDEAIKAIVSEPSM